MTQVFTRDRVTWVMYVVLGWFAYLQAAPGLVVPHLRDELDLSYSTGGLHVAAFAAGSMAATSSQIRLPGAIHSSVNPPPKLPKPQPPKQQQKRPP